MSRTWLEDTLQGNIFDAQTLTNLSQLYHCEILTKADIVIHYYVWWKSTVSKGHSLNYSINMFYELGHECLF